MRGPEIVVLMLQLAPALRPDEVEAMGVVTCVDLLAARARLMGRATAAADDQGCSPAAADAGGGRQTYGFRGNAGLADLMGMLRLQQRGPGRDGSNDV